MTTASATTVSETTTNETTTTARKATRSLFAFGLAVLAAAGLLLMGCDSGGSTTSGGTLAVQLTDAPGDIVEAEVTIEEVTAVPAEDSSEEGDGGISVLTDSSLTVDLTTLQNGVTTLLGEVQLEPGTYSQIRLKTAREASVFCEDSTGTAHLPRTSRRSEMDFRRKTGARHRKAAEPGPAGHGAW